jgi:putative (di)nucleoside polyphosphate hydrolase
MSNSYRSGVGIMLFNNKGEVLIGERIKPADVWQMPQGGIDNDESPQDALLREVSEEIGTTKWNVVAESKEWMHYDFPKEFRDEWFCGKYIGQSQKWFLLEFLGEDRYININTGEPEFTDWKWINISDLVEIIADFKKPMYISIIKEFHPLILKHLK